MCRVLAKSRRLYIYTATIYVSGSRVYDIRAAVRTFYLCKYQLRAVPEVYRQCLFDQISEAIGYK